MLEQKIAKFKNQSMNIGLQNFQKQQQKMLKGKSYLFFKK